MLAAERRWEERSQRPFLPRALSVADVAQGGAGQRLDFLIEGIGPGTDRLCELEPGEGVWVNGPLGNAFSEPRELAPLAAGAILVGGGIGIAPLALLRRRFAASNISVRVLLGFRDVAHCGGVEDFFSCCEVRLASEDGHLGRRGYVTDLLAAMLDGDDARSAVVYSCGPPAMLGVVNALCLERGIVCELAMESPMACGYGACFGCAVPRSDGSYMRLCVEGPVIRPSPSGPEVEGSPPPRASGGDKQSLPRGRGLLGLKPPGLEAVAFTPPSQEPRGALGFCGIELQHPVINASGTFDAIAAWRVYGDALLEGFPFSAFVSKTITPKARIGNAPLRIWETPGGMINSIGLPNKGLEGFLSEDLPQLAKVPVPLIVSVMGTSREEFCGLVTALAEREEVAAIELNVSCPNVRSGLIVGEQPSEAQALLEALRPLTVKPLIVKLTPNLADPAPVALAVERGGADAVSMINTVKASAIDPLTLRPAIAVGNGGLSGPAVRAIAIAQLRAVAAAVDLPIVGMGGVSSGADAREFLAAGATLVAVGTESFRDPLAARRVAAELSSDFDSQPD